MKSSQSSSRKSQNFGKSEIVKVEFSPIKSLYKHPEVYTAPMNRTTFVINDYEMEERIEELKHICNSNKPYVKLPRRVHDPFSLRKKVKEVQSLTSQIQKEIQSVSNNTEKYLQALE